MPFEVFKPPKIQVAIASTVGKATGIAVSKGTKTVFETTKVMKAKGCPSPAELAKVDSQVAQLGSLGGALNAQLVAFKAIPIALKAPVAGIRAAVKSILSIAIPQAFPHVYVGPPGLPVSITLKFYDLCNMLKEMAAAFELTGEAVSSVIKSAESNSGMISKQSKLIEAPIKACKVNQSIEENLTKEQAGKLGLLDASGALITSTLGSKVLEETNTRPASEQLKLDLAAALGIAILMKGAADAGALLFMLKNPIAAGASAGDTYRLLPPGTVRLETGETVKITGNQFAIFTDNQTSTSSKDKNTGKTIIDILDKDGNKSQGTINSLDTDENSTLTLILETPKSLKPGGITGANQALSELNSALSNISEKLTFSSDALTDEVGVSTEVLEKLKKDLEDISTGITTKKDEELIDPDLYYKGYLLKIIRDPASPKLAPKHFAVGIRNGKQEVKGPSSFSSSKKVLLNEIKFRIDNQLS